MNLQLEEIQGNIFGGFNKDHAIFIFLEITDAELAKTLFRSQVLEDVRNSSSAQVLRFNNQFKKLKHQGVPEGTIVATWTNLVFSAEGLKKLKASDLARFPDAFIQGPIKRASIVGDVDKPPSESGAVVNGPEHWNDGMTANVAWDKVDALIIVASDDPMQLDENLPSSRVRGYLDAIRLVGSGVRAFDLVRGETRSDDIGHEHFGFKDGVSQPGIRGVTQPDDPLGNPSQGNPGQDLLHPGEFVLGYPRQIPKKKEGVDDPNPDPGAISGEQDYDNAGEIVKSKTPMPEWAKNGSFLVFRRLAQDVAGFRESVNRIASELLTHPDLLGAKLVGRYKSGAPLEPIKFQSGIGPSAPALIDPAKTNPALANSDSINNDFEYGDDKEGSIVPQAAHIRKAYPRDQTPALEEGKTPNREGAESRTQTHRLLRRGIPFGNSLGAIEGGSEKDPRGLLFLAYQSDIERQFEFVQKHWINDQNFPEKDAGQDPLLTNTSKEGVINACPFHHKGSGPSGAKCPVSFQHFVSTRGAGYYFSPSISALNHLL